MRSIRLTRLQTRRARHNASRPQVEAELRSQGWAAGTRLVAIDGRQRLGVIRPGPADRKAPPSPDVLWRAVLPGVLYLRTVSGVPDRLRSTRAISVGEMEQEIRDRLGYRVRIQSWTEEREIGIWHGSVEAQATGSEPRTEPGALLPSALEYHRAARARETEQLAHLRAEIAALEAQAQHLEAADGEWELRIREDPSGPVAPEGPEKETDRKSVV